jgi:hypothetical protein
MTCAINKRNSNDTGLAFAEEECFKQLPTPVAAFATLVFSGTGTADDTVTIGGVVYTLKAVPANPNEIDIGVDAATTAANLRAAINHGAGEGTAYGTGTTAHPTVEASGAGANVIVTAKAAGTLGNNIAVAEAGTGTAFSGAATKLSGGVDQIWYGLEANSYPDFGGELSAVARSPIDPSRQNKKGTVTDLDANGGYNHDVVNDLNYIRQMQGFFFASVRQKPTTAPMNGARNVITGVTAATDKYALTNTGIAFNLAGLIVKASGFGVTANNGLHVVVSADTDDVTVADGTANEASPPADATLEVVGYEFDTAEAGITKTGNLLSLTDSGNALASLGLNVGEWIFLGGDAASNADSFVNNKGFARIKSIAAGTIAFDDTTFEGATEVSTGKKIRIFFGNVIRNEKDPSLIVRRSYQFERTLGMGETDTQAEYIEGAVANELTLNIPAADKLNADLSFVAADNTYRSGEVDDKIKSDSGTAFVPAIGADAYNSTSHVYRMKMYVVDPTDSCPTSLFGYVTEGNISINNGITPDKAIGVLGAFDTSTGNFVVGGSLTAYFTTVAAVKAVRANSDVGFNIIIAAENAGFIYDIPLLGLGGGRINVEKDRPITVPLEPAGAENPNGYTMLYNFFPYLPDAAMPE